MNRQQNQKSIPVQYSNVRRNQGRRPKTHEDKGKFYYKYDYFLLLIITVLTLFGAMMIYSVGGMRYLKGHAVGMVLGYLAIFALAIFPMSIDTLRKKGPLKKGFMAPLLSLPGFFLMFAYFLQILLKFKGKDINGSTRWLTIPVIGYTFEPVEISKVAVIVFTAFVLYENFPVRDFAKMVRESEWFGKHYFIQDSFENILYFLRNPLKIIFKVYIYVGILIIIVLKENLSSAIILFAITFGLCMITSKRFKSNVAMIVVFAAVGGLFLGMFSNSYRSVRIHEWLIVANSRDQDSQTLQGLYGIASGGLKGTGIGNGIQKFSVPEAYNDMIFSVVCEELGLIGAIILVLLYLLLVWRIMVIGCSAPSLFGSLLCFGVMIQIFAQMIINIGVVTATLPNTGVLLPFFSAGGTAESILLAELGVVLQISKTIKLKK